MHVLDQEADRSHKPRNTECRRGNFSKLPTAHHMCWSGVCSFAGVYRCVDFGTRACRGRGLHAPSDNRGFGTFGSVSEKLKNSSLQNFETETRTCLAEKINATREVFKNIYVKLPPAMNK